MNYQLFIALQRLKKIQKQEFCLKLMNVKKAKNMFNHPEGQAHPRPPVHLKKVKRYNFEENLFGKSLRSSAVISTYVDHFKAF